MAFLINTSAVVTLTDLGNRILSSGLSSFDLGTEFKIEELRYSNSLIAAIEAGQLEVVDDGRGRSITGPVSAGVATAFVRDIYHFEDIDVQTIVGTTNLDELNDVTLSSPVSIGEALVWNGSSWENQAVAGGVSSVNSQTGVVVLDTDDISEGVTNLYYTDTRARGALSIAAGSTNYLGYNSGTGEFSITALAITTVTVEGTQTSLANWVAANYTVGNEYQEGDVIILTAITGGTETYIHNGGTAVTVADWSLIQQPNVDQTTVRGWFSATDPISYNSGTGDFSLSIKANGGLVVETTELAVDLGASSITGTLAVGDGGTGATATPTNGQLLIGNGSNYSVASLTSSESTIDIAAGVGTLDLDVADSSLGETKLNITGSPAVGQAGDVLKSDGAGGFEWGTTAGSLKTWSWGASSNASNTTNRYISRHDGAPTNQSPYVSWYNGNIRAISLSSASASTWIAEVHVNGSLVTSLASGGNQYARSSGLSVALVAGDRVSFYVNGTGVNKPSIDALFEEV